MWQYHSPAGPHPAEGREGEGEGEGGRWREDVYLHAAYVEGSVTIFID